MTVDLFSRFSKQENTSRNCHRQGCDSTSFSRSGTRGTPMNCSISFSIGKGREVVPNWRPCSRFSTPETSFRHHHKQEYPSTPFCRIGLNLWKGKFIRFDRMSFLHAWYCRVWSPDACMTHHLTVFGRVVSVMPRFIHVAFWTGCGNPGVRSIFWCWKVLVSQFHLDQDNIWLWLEDWTDPGVSTDPCNKFRIWRYTLSQLTTLQIFHDDPLLEHVSQASVPTCQFLEAPTFDITDRSPSRLISPCLGMIHLVSTEPKRFITPIRHCSVDTELICWMICAK